MGLEDYDEVCKVRAENLQDYLDSVEPVLTYVSENIDILENPPYFNTGELRQVHTVKDIDTDIPRTHQINEALGFLARNDVLRFNGDDGLWTNSDVCHEFDIYRYTEEKMEGIRQFVNKRIEEADESPSPYARETNFTVDLTGFNADDYI